MYTIKSFAYDNNHNYRPGDCILKIYDFHVSHEPTINRFHYTNVDKVMYDNNTFTVYYHLNNGRLCTAEFDVFDIKSVTIGYFEDDQATLLGLEPDDKYYEVESTSYVMNYKIIYEDPEDKLSYRDTIFGVKKIWQLDDFIYESEL